MAYDVFISYSSKDKAAADEVCAALEARSIPCWIAPRDITPGTEWSEAIINALEECRVMVLLFSADSNKSPQVKREAERAVSKGVILLPVRIENVYPSGAMEYYLSTSHWMDAVQPAIGHHLNALVNTVEALLASGDSDTPAVGLSEDSAAKRATATAVRPRPLASSERELPEGLSGFNLGAFLLNRNWLASHNAPAGFILGLVLILPYAGLLLWLVFGAAMSKIALICSLGIIGWLWAGFRGNELAWENRVWIDAEHFRPAQSGWAIKGLTFWAIVAVLSVTLVKTGLNRVVAGRATAAATKFMKSPMVSNIRKSAGSTTNPTTSSKSHKAAPKARRD